MKFTVIKGNRYYNVNKGSRGNILDVTLWDSGMGKVVLEFPNKTRFTGLTRFFTHVYPGQVVNLHKGDPTKKIQIRVEE